MAEKKSSISKKRDLVTPSKFQAILFASDIESEGEKSEKKAVLRRRDLVDISTESSGDSADEILLRVQERKETSLGREIVEAMEVLSGDVGLPDPPSVTSDVAATAYDKPTTSSSYYYKPSSSYDVPSTSYDVPSTSYDVPSTSYDVPTMPTASPFTRKKRSVAESRRLLSAKRSLFGNDSDDELDFDESEGSEESDVGLDSGSEWEEADEESDDGGDNLVRPLPTGRGRLGGPSRRGTRGRRATRRRGGRGRARFMSPRAQQAADEMDREAGWTTEASPPTEIPFIGTPGLKDGLSHLTTALDFIQLFITRYLLVFIAEQTNIYAEQRLVGMASESSNAWLPVTARDIAQYLGLVILMGVVRKPSLRDYWSTSELLLTPIFMRTMTCRRFLQIATFFHVTNNADIPDGNVDRLVKVRSILDYFRTRFRDVYTPSRELSIDEGMLPWKGRLRFKVYNPAKPTKYGIKFYIIAEARSGYVSYFEAYSGTYTSTRDTVFSLIGDLRGKGYQLYMDNYYNSVALSKELYDNGIHTCGTLRLARGGPKVLQGLAKTKLVRDQVYFRRNNETFVIIWMDSTLVKLVSNIHNAATENYERRQRGTRNLLQLNRPQAISDYNTYMGGVDHFDQMIRYYQFTRRTSKWTKKFVIYLFQMALFNSFALYRKYTRDARKKNFKAFSLYLADVLIHFKPEQWPCKPEDKVYPGQGMSAAAPAGPHTSDSDVDPDDPALPAPGTRRKRAATPAFRRPRVLEPQVRYAASAKHKLAAVKKNRRRRCRRCWDNNIRRDTVWYCSACKVHLCKDTCFKPYHRKRTSHPPPPPSQ